MFDESRLKAALAKYKNDFIPMEWKNEKYKWEAVKFFQDHWDIHSSKFADMLEQSLSKTDNLLASMNNYPAERITKFAKAFPEEVRAMFMDLYNEKREVYERIELFKKKSELLLEKYENGEGQHYQDERAISTYLWLRFPDKYYVYKFSEVKRAAKELGSDYKFKKGAYADNLRNSYRFYEEINAVLKKDTELITLFKTQLTDTCYPDPELRTLTFDFGFYISRYISKGKEKAAEKAGWWPDQKKYTPGITPQQWKELFHDSEVFSESAWKIVKRMLDYGGEATCKQLSNKYGETPNFYNAGSMALAKRVFEATKCRLVTDDDEKTKWWPILYQGKAAENGDEGTFIWKLRPELQEALKEADLSSVVLYAADSEGKVSNAEKPEPYSKEDFLSEDYMSEQSYDRLVGVLQNKLNIILQGAPGVGKTFCAKRLAYSLMGEKDDSRIEFVQFHQNYSYEDFVLGYRPSTDGFELKSGIFYNFCDKAAKQRNKKFFFIIDEINRGNLSKIFGELLMLIEKDYRNEEATLAYNGKPFSVPDNLYIIGMMNTADRSLAMIDYALRRRFSFFEIAPAFESEGFSSYQNGVENETFDHLIAEIIELNEEIRRDKSLGKGFCIGHSYFCGRTKENCTDEWMQSVVDYDILPMLSEYWFDDESKVQRWANKLHGVFQ